MRRRSILDDRQDTDRLLAWSKEGVVDPRAISVLYVLGRYTADQVSNPVDLLAFLGVEEPPFRDWMMCAFGPNEMRCAALAALLRGHVRIGFENNFYLPGGELAARNADLVASTAQTLKTLHMDWQRPATSGHYGALVRPRRRIIYPCNCEAGLASAAAVG